MKYWSKPLVLINTSLIVFVLSVFSVNAQPAKSRVGVEVQRRDRVTATEGVSQQKNVELLCRGGANSFTFEKYGEDRALPSGETLVSLRFTFRASPFAAGLTGSGLQPGTCSWVDRTLNDNEPRAIIFDTLANAQLKQKLKGTPVDHSATAAENYPDAITIPAYLNEGNHYFTFMVRKALPSAEYFSTQHYRAWKSSVKEMKPGDLTRQP